MATIGDVAREAGVSRSTVSSVLTGRKPVTPVTRERIEAAIAKLNFTVNHGARALATSRTMVIGIVVQLHGPEFAPAMAPWVFALSDAAHERGYDVLLLTDSDPLGAIKRVTRTRRVDGLVLLSVLDEDVRLRVVSSLDIPAVLLGLPRDSRGIDAVDLDFGAAAGRLIQHLYDNGHRKVLFARRSVKMFAAGFSFVRQFNDALVARAAEAGMQLRPFHCPDDPEQLPAVLEQALRDRGTATALILHDDAAAVLLPTALIHTGLTVPEDISVVSLHSTELSRSLALPFTSIESDSARISYATMSTLMRRLVEPVNSERGVVHELLTPRLTDRGSVKDLTR
jgi:DNA-binding LacI/PurR family transcriptional regulator